MQTFIVEERLETSGVQHREEERNQILELRRKTHRTCPDPSQRRQWKQYFYEG